MQHLRDLTAEKARANAEIFDSLDYRLTNILERIFDASLQGDFSIGICGNDARQDIQDALRSRGFTVQPSGADYMVSWK